MQVLCGPPAPDDVRFTTDAAQVDAFLRGCGVARREAYRALPVADLLYPLILAMFLAWSLALARLARPSGARRPGGSASVGKRLRLAQGPRCAANPADRRSYVVQ